MLAARPGSAFNGGRSTQAGRPISAGALLGSSGRLGGRPSSAASGWPGTQKGAGGASAQMLYRPGSAASLGRSKQSLFSPAFAGEGAGTRSMKDWQVAGDLMQRGQRHDVRSLKRLSASTGQLPNAAEVAADCPLARGPLGETNIGLRPQSASWHKKKVKQIYKVLDPTQDGAIRLEQLRDSFEVLSVPINDETFEQYAQDLLPSGSRDPDATVKASDFKNFHKQVWANQPGLVRWYAGDPADGAAPRPAAQESPVMRRCGSAPTGVTTGELRNNEVMLRKTFMRHADGKSALVSFDSLPAILQDLGLPQHLPDLLDDSEVGEELSFHQTVSIVNKCIATHEANRELDPTSAAATKVSERLEAALRYSSVMDDAESSDEEGALIMNAQRALEAALFGDGGDDTPKTKARAALELAFGGMDSDDEDPIVKAQKALEAALFGDEDEDEDPIIKAQKALEQALFGMDDDPEDLKNAAQQALEAALFGIDDEPQDLKNAAQQALEAALFGGGNVDEDEGGGNEDDLRQDAANALEAALFGKPPEPKPEDIDLIYDAQDALEAALFGGAA